MRKPRSERICSRSRFATPTTQVVVGKGLLRYVDLGGQVVEAER